MLPTSQTQNSMTTIGEMSGLELVAKRDALRKELNIHEEDDITDFTHNWLVIKEVYENEIRRLQAEIERRKA